MNYYADYKGKLFHPGGFSLTERAIKYCSFKKEALIADIGSGAGESARLIEKTFPIRVLSIEPSKEMIGLNPLVYNAPGENTPFRNESIDGALWECSISLCKHLEAALSEMRRIIKPGGFIIICDVYSKTGTVKADGLFRWFYSKDCLLAAMTGFEVLLFEDHTRELSKMRARLIMEDREYELCQSLTEHTAKNAGYFLLIARRK